MITFETIEHFYNNLSSNGINCNNNFLYTYCFISDDKINLQELNKELNKNNFSSITIEESEEDYWWLNASRIEKHDAHSLFELNKILYALAEKYTVEYDGFDIGNPDGQSAIERDTYMVPEEFKTGDFINNNLPELVIINTALESFSHKAEFRYFINFTLPYITPDGTGLPSNEDLQNLHDFEISIEQHLQKSGINSYYVLRTTYNGIRKFYLAIAEKGNAINILESMKPNTKEQHFTYNIIEDENWSMYNEMLIKLATE